MTKKYVIEGTFLSLVFLSFMYRYVLYTERFSAGMRAYVIVDFIYIILLFCVRVVRGKNFNSEVKRPSFFHVMKSHVASFYVPLYFSKRGTNNIHSHMN